MFIKYSSTKTALELWKIVEKRYDSPYEIKIKYAKKDGRTIKISNC